MIIRGFIAVDTRLDEVADIVKERLNAKQIQKGSGYCNIDEMRVRWCLISKIKEKQNAN